MISAEPVLTALMLAEKNPPVLEIAVEDAAWCVWENWLLRWRIWDLSRVEQVYVNSRGLFWGSENMGCVQMKMVPLI